MAAAAASGTTRDLSTDHSFHKDILSSVIAEIKSYDGADPLRPWLRGIRKMRASLPPAVLEEKLPRFLQRCVQEFEEERLYRDDSRYVRVWIELMDYVDDAKPLLKSMERKKIGQKRASFYLAYALYYEKRKKFEEAERMYHLGVEKLAEPADELTKSYEQFLQRMELYKKRRAAKEAGTNKENQVGVRQAAATGESLCQLYPKPTKNLSRHERSIVPSTKKLPRGNSDDTFVFKFVGSAFVGKSEAEEACHHGLVEPTINTREALSTISSMFQEPVEPETALCRRQSKRSRLEPYQRTNNDFQIYVDEGHDVGPKCNRQIMKKMDKKRSGGLGILADDQEGSRSAVGKDGSSSSSSFFVLPDDDGTEEVKPDVANASISGAMRNQGLFEPTMTTRDAMAEINAMFGKPIDF